MDVFTEFSEVAVLLGEPSRIMMLWHLLGGETRPAGELAFLANISPQSASMHLSKLVAAEMLAVTKKGRNRFYSIARPEVASFVESMAALLPSAGERANFSKAQTSDFRLARSCYDHLAGTLSVELVAALKKQNFLSAEQDEFVVTERGEKLFADFGINLVELKKQRRSFAKKCLDWSERKHHLAGALGAALFRELLKRKWLARSRGRTIRLTFDGRKNLDLLFQVKL